LIGKCLKAILAARIAIYSLPENNFPQLLVTLKQRVPDFRQEEELSGLKTRCSMNQQ